MAFRRVKTALIGSGAISKSYLTNMTQKFHVLDVVGCSDIIPERSAKRAEEFGIRQMTNEEIWNDPDIEIVVNTTYPKSHYEVTRKSLEAGKHVVTEKMIAVTLEEGRELVELARSRNLMLATAPDTFLGGGWQTARHLIDAGFIGEPVSVYGVCIRSYQDHSDTFREPKSMVLSAGGGIPFDMGGYYLHNMINLLGPLTRVSGFMQTRNPVRPYTNPRHPKFGETFTVDSPNNMAAALEFACGTIGTLTITSEAAGYMFGDPRVEVHGTQGSLILFDPNDFGGKITLRRNTQEQPAEMPIMFPFSEECRGIGAADLAYALLNGRKPRADCSIGLHAFEAVHGIWKSSDEGIMYTMQSTCERPEALPFVALAGSAYEAILDN
ncbi:MAG TPA: Gfo/Idh/MocA family oxidoreductase [Candidatus Gallacutalibacter pullistercoris]|nr:Gfo/Idh/MocA family oxidoreductase [Candidatus Gallacutalibacter pullistercoris]